MSRRFGLLIGGLVLFAAALLLLEWRGPAPVAPPGSAPPDPETARLLDQAAAQLAAGSPGGLVLAADLFRRILEVDPDHAEARYGLGRAELGSGRTWAGLWHMHRLVRRHPRHAGGWSALGLEAHAGGAWEDVVAALRSVGGIRPLDGNETRALADACLRSQRAAAAESLLTGLIEREPDEPSLRSARAAARKLRGDNAGAAADWRDALAGRDRPFGARFADRMSRAGALLELGRTEEAATELDAADDEGERGSEGGAPADTLRYHVLRARVLDRSGAPRAALHHLDTAVAIDSLDVDALHLEARLLRRLGDREGAKRAAERHRRAVAAHNFKDRMDALKALTQGAIADEAGDAAGAIAAWEKGLEAAPDDLSLHSVLAPAYQRRGDRERALASFTVLRRAMGGAVPGPIFFETALELRRRGLRSLAAAQFALASDRQPGDERAIFHHARARTELGDWDAALEIAAPLERPRSAAGSGRAR